MLDHIRNTAGAPDKYADVFEKLDRALKGLQALNYDTDAYVRLEKVTSSIWKMAAPSNQPNLVKNSDGDVPETAKLIRRLERVARNLQELRDSLVHRHEQAGLLERPAYSLEDDGD